MAAYLQGLKIYETTTDILLLFECTILVKISEKAHTAPVVQYWNVHTVADYIFVSAYLMKLCC